MKAAAKAVDVLKINNARNLTSGKVVVALNPRYDESDSGTNGNGVREENLNYKIATYCKLGMGRKHTVKVESN